MNRFLAEGDKRARTRMVKSNGADPSVREYHTKVSDANRDKARQVLDELMGEEVNFFSELMLSQGQGK